MCVLKYLCLNVCAAVFHFILSMYKIILLFYFSSKWKHANRTFIGLYVSERNQKDAINIMGLVFSFLCAYQCATWYLPQASSPNPISISTLTVYIIFMSKYSLLISFPLEQMLSIVYIFFYLREFFFSKNKLFCKPIF